MGYIWIIVVAFCAALIAVVLFRTARFARPSEPIVPAELIPVDAAAVAEHLAAAVRCQTVSTGSDDPVNTAAFDELHRQLAQMFPLIHSRLERQVIAGHSLLFTWRGVRADLKPVLLMAHQDVVPADPATLPEWEQPPFEGRIADGYVWGRGTQDCKGQMIAILESAEHLLRAGFQPQRTIYLSFGHDEEVGGKGAQEAVRWLQAQSVRLEAVLDEGGSLLEGLLPGVKEPVALIGSAEKGYLTLELSVTQSPGHSSMPPKQTAIGILARALSRLESRPLPARVEAIMPMFEGIGMAMPFMYRAALANLWLLGGVVKRMFEVAPQTNAAIRTTTAVTMISGGVKDNILPREARAAVNFRLLSGDRIDDVIAHVRQAIRDERVQVQRQGSIGGEASPASPIDGAIYRQLSSVVRQVFGPVPVAPFVLMGASDARHFAPICENIYRFTPMCATQADMARVHGINEQISVAGLGKMVQFYARLLNVWCE